jgi:hypothetical protein
MPPFLEVAENTNSWFYQPFVKIEKIFRDGYKYLTISRN